jgi:hypothetical protein
MVNTAASHLSDKILWNPGEVGTQTVPGKLAADTYPAQAVFKHTDDLWYKADSDTAAHKLLNVAAVGHRQRIRHSSLAEVGIDDAWDVSEAEDKDTPIITSGFVTMFITDPGATLMPGTPMMVSATAGSLCALAQGHAGAALDQIVVGTLARKVVSGDTVAIIAIGAFKGRTLAYNPG